MSGDGSAPRNGIRQVLALAASLALPLPWLLHRALGLPTEEPLLQASLGGLAILGAAFVLSWATELAERDLPQAFALLILALVGVLPEYAVDLHFAVRAATEPHYAHYAVANMTGANRLLIGFGWAAVVLLSCARERTRELDLAGGQRVEMRFLLFATLWAFVVPVNGAIDLLDAAALLGLFAWYAVTAARGESEEVDLVGPAAWIAERVGDGARRAIAIALFAFAAASIFLAAEPFAEGMVSLGMRIHVDEFLLVQWVAPIASESPEFIVALLFAWRGRGRLGIGALISSKVNQWTLLVGALPLAFIAAGGAWTGLHLDHRQSHEIWLTAAQSLLATTMIADGRFSRFEAVLLAALFAVQLVLPSDDVRMAFSLLYVALTLGLLVHSPMRRAAMLSLLRHA